MAEIDDTLKVPPSLADKLSAYTGRFGPYDESVIPIPDRPECQEYADRIGGYLMGQHNRWCSTRQILDNVGRDHIRMFDAAIGLLVGHIEMRGVGITYYRWANIRRGKDIRLGLRDMFLLRKEDDG